MEALVASGSNYFNMETMNEAAMEALVSSDSVGRTSFQWGGSISAMLVTLPSLTSSINILSVAFFFF